MIFKKLHKYIQQLTTLIRCNTLLRILHHIVYRNDSKAGIRAGQALPSLQFTFILKFYLGANL
jgi:hypothetical protein